VGSASRSSITSKTASKLASTARIASRSAGQQLPLVDRRIRRADQIEDRRARFGGVQVVSSAAM
jgi:hypothetical protein